MSACSAACTAPMMRDGFEAGGEQRLERQGVPAGARRELARREVERHHVEHLVGRGALALVGDQVVQHRHRAEVRDPGTRRHRLLGGEDRDVGLLAGLGVLVGVVGGIEHGHLVLDVELAHPVLTTLVQVDRAGVGDVQGARRVDRAHQAAVGVDELALDRRARAQPHPRRGCLAPGPVHRAAARLQLVVEHEIAYRRRRARRRSSARRCG